MLWGVIKDNFLQILKEVQKGKTQQEIAKIFHVGQPAIAMRIKRNPILQKSHSDKTKLSTTNELLSGKQGIEVAKLYDISKGRVSQIWGNFTNELIELYETGTPKKELVEIQKELILIKV